MSYSYRISDLIDDVERAAWQRVCAESGASIFMDPRFIESVETSMKQSLPLLVCHHLRRRSSRRLCGPRRDVREPGRARRSALGAGP